jgi:hypothetical protein
MRIRDAIGCNTPQGSGIGASGSYNFVVSGPPALWCPIHAFVYDLGLYWYPGWVTASDSADATIAQSGSSKQIFEILSS